MCKTSARQKSLNFGALYSPWSYIPQHQEASQQGHHHDQVPSQPRGGGSQKGILLRPLNRKKGSIQEKALYYVATATGRGHYASAPICVHFASHPPLLPSLFPEESIKKRRRRKGRNCPWGMPNVRSPTLPFLS